jgi:hypothetical protein
MNFAVMVYKWVHRADNRVFFNPIESIFPVTRKPNTWQLYGVRACLRFRLYRFRKCTKSTTPKASTEPIKQNKTSDAFFMLSAFILPTAPAARQPNTAQSNASVRDFVSAVSILSVVVDVVIKYLCLWFVLTLAYSEQSNKRDLIALTAATCLCQTELTPITSGAASNRDEEIPDWFSARA